MKLLRRILRGEQGFTLVELMVVVIILGILAAIAVPQFMNRAAQAKQNAALSSLQSMQSVVNLYMADNGTYPSSTGISTAMQNGGINWSQKDPWGNNFQYLVSSDQKSYTIFCGPDSDGNYYEATSSSSPHNVGNTEPTTAGQ